MHPVARDSEPPIPRLPAVDEALILFCVVLLLLFYISPNFLRHGLMAEAVGNEVLLILAPTLLFALVAHLDWKKTFSFKRAPVPILVAAALLGIGLSPWAPLLKTFQDKLWHPDPEAERALEHVPELVLVVVHVERRDQPPLARRRRRLRPLGDDARAAVHRPDTGRSAWRAWRAGTRA